MVDISQPAKIVAALRKATHNMGVGHRTAWQAAEFIEAQAIALKKMEAQLSQARAEGAEAMREQCAEICDTFHKDLDGNPIRVTPSYLSDAIRALPTQEQKT